MRTQPDAAGAALRLGRDRHRALGLHRALSQRRHRRRAQLHVQRCSARCCSGISSRASCTASRRRSSRTSGRETSSMCSRRRCAISEYVAGLVAHQHRDQHDRARRSCSRSRPAVFGLSFFDATARRRSRSCSCCSCSALRSASSRARSCCGSGPRRNGSSGRFRRCCRRSPAVFYPVAVLPAWMQWFAHLLPPSYVFEGMRAIVAGHGFSWEHACVGIRACDRADRARAVCVRARVPGDGQKRAAGALQRRERRVSQVYRGGLPPLPLAGEGWGEGTSVRARKIALIRLRHLLPQAGEGKATLHLELLVEDALFERVLRDRTAASSSARAIRGCALRRRRAPRSNRPSR